MSPSTTFFCNYTIGSDAYEAVGEVCRGYGKRILVICGEKSKMAALSTLETALKPTELEIVETLQFGTDCTKTAMKTCVSAINTLKPDMIFAMGGGKALDTAKGAAFLADLPIFTFPTIAATCAGTTALSVVYDEEGNFEEFMFFKRPPHHCFIHLGIISKAPVVFLRAGMGDTLGKYFECHFSARGDILAHSSRLGREISNLCYEPLLEHGVNGISAVKNQEVTSGLEEVVLAIIVSTGLVSLLVLDEYNCAIAHSVYYGLVLLEGFEEENLHGDVVGYGVLVQLAIDKNKEELKRVQAFLKSIGIRCTLAEMKAVVSEKVLKEIANGPDMAHIPYKVTEEMIQTAMNEVETL